MIRPIDTRTNRMVPGQNPVEPELSASTRPGALLDAETQAAYLVWRRAHDDDYAYDEICNFVDATLSRGELVRLLDAVTGYSGDLPVNGSTSLVVERNRIHGS